MTKNHRNLIAACAAISVFGLSFGMLFPLLSLILEDQGVSGTMIGVNASMGTLGIVVFSPFIPALSKRFGSRRIALFAAGITVMTVLSLKLFQNLEAWFVLRFVHGAAIAVMWALSEAWIVRYADDRKRGRIVAIYSSIMSVSFGIGPLIIGTIGIDGWTPFLLGAVILLAGMIPLALIRDEGISEPEESAPSGILEFVPKAPLLLSCVLVFAMFDAASLSLLPVYGVYNGLAIDESAYLLSAMVIGNIVMQYPIGWLADRIAKRIILIACALAAGLFLILLPLTIDSMWKWPTIIAVGASGYGIYTVALADLGDRFRGAELVNGAASFASVWGIGAFLGSISGGWALVSSTDWGLPGYLAVCYVLLGMALILRQSRVVRATP